MTHAEQLDALIYGTLDSAGFGHENHIGVAFEALGRFEFFKAYEVISKGLQGVAARAGVPEKFNATITFAFLSTIAERMANGTYGDAETFVARNLDLVEKTFLARRYSEARLACPLARRVPLLPDVA